MENTLEKAALQADISENTARKYRGDQPLVSKSNEWMFTFTHCVGSNPLTPTTIVAKDVSFFKTGPDLASIE